MPKTKQHQQGKASTELKNLVNEWADSYIKSVDLPVKIMKLAEDEGVSKSEIRKLISDALLKRGLGARRIRELIPQELKELNKVNRPKPYAAESAASDKAEQSEDDKQLQEELDNMDNLPVTSPDTIIQKSEGEIAEAQFIMDSKAEMEVPIKFTSVQQLIDNKIIDEDQVIEWIISRHEKLFTIPVDINMTDGAYHERLSPGQAIMKLKQFGTNKILLDIGWRILK